jgi:serine/threonine protein kinase
MRLDAGGRLGPYEIVAPLGAGGMGEVFRATDVRLHRTVAIKISPRDKVADFERKRRFLQEARAASALNHPNIVTLHDIAQDAGMDYLVMEYVPGKSLDKRIPAKGAAGDGSSRLRDADRERAGRAARGGDRAPRHQAGQRDGDA